MLTALGSANATLNGILTALGGRVTAAAGGAAVPALPGTRSLSSGATPQPSWKVSIYLDGRILAGAVSKILFDEERTHAGPSSLDGSYPWA